MEKRWPPTFCIWDNFFHAMHNDPSTLSVSNSHPHQLKNKERGLVFCCSPLGLLHGKWMGHWCVSTESDPESVHARIKVCWEWR